MAKDFKGDSKGSCTLRLLFFLMVRWKIIREHWEKETQIDSHLVLNQKIDPILYNHTGSIAPVITL